MNKTLVYEQISIKDIKPLLGKIRLIDIREIHEYQSGHLPYSVNVPAGVLLHHPAKYLDKHIPTYLVCRSGRRTAQACEMLSEQGYRVVDVTEGIIAYDGDLE